MIDLKTDKLAFSTSGACLAADVGKTKLFEALSTGALKSRLMGRKRIILREDLVAWLQALPEGTGASSPAKSHQS